MNRVESAVCRIRQKLPGNEGFVTLGSGCVVRCQHLASKCGWKNPNIILTSNSVLNKEALASDRVFVADFISNEKKGLETFDLKLAAETCKEIARHELLSDSSAKSNAGSKSNVNDEAFTALLTAVSVEHLDKRSFLKRMVKKSTLQTSRPIDCYGGDAKDFEEDLMCDGFLYCLVLCEKPSRHKSSNDFETQTFKCNYNRESEQFVLEHFGGGTCLQYAKDFNDEERPYGAVISSKKGEFVGVLDFNKDGIFPLFVPRGISVDEKVVNNNLDRSSTSEAEGDQESVERDSDLVEVDHKPAATAPHEAEESIAEEMSKGSNVEIGRILKPAAEEASTEQDPGSYPATYHAVSGAGEADSKVGLSEEADNDCNVAGKADSSGEVKLETKPFSEETGIPEKRDSETDVQSESPEIAEPTDILEQNKGIEPESTDQVGTSESQRELEEKFPVEELESPKEETPAPQDKDVQHDLLDNETVEQQDMTVERVETYDRQVVTQSESQSEKLLAADMQQPAIPQSQEETENISKREDEKVLDRMDKAVSQTMPDEVELPVENVPQQNNSESFAEASDIVLTSSSVGTSDNTEAKNLEPEEVELSLDRQAPEIDLESIVETGTISSNKDPESSLETESQPEVYPSSKCRIVPTNIEEPKAQIEGIPSIAEIQDEGTETFEHGNNLHVASEADSKICSRTELDENNLDLQQDEPPRTETTLSTGIGERTDSDTTKKGEVNETQEESEIELIAPTNTTGVEVSKEVPDIELGVPSDSTEAEVSSEVPKIELDTPTDTTGVEVSKEVPDIELGVPSDPTEAEVSSEVPKIELGTPTDTTGVEVTKEVPDIELGVPSDQIEAEVSSEVPKIELGTPTDTTGVEVSKEVPDIELGVPSDSTEAEVSSEVPKIELDTPTDTTGVEVTKEVPDIELGVPSDPIEAEVSSEVPKIELGTPTDTTGVEVSKEVPDIELGIPTDPTEAEVSSKVPKIELGTPTDTTDVEMSKEVPDIELGVPTDPTKAEVNNEVPVNELAAPTDKTMLEDNKELSKMELGTPTEIEHGARMDTTELEEGKEVPEINIGEPPEIDLGAPLDSVAEDSKELPEIGLGAPREIQPCAPIDTAELEEDKKEPVIETGAPAEIELSAPEDSVDSKVVPEVEHGAPTEMKPCVPMDTAGLEEGKVAPAINSSEPLVTATAEQEGKSISEVAISEPKETEEIQYKKNIPATELGDGVVASVVEEESKDQVDLSFGTIEAESKEAAETHPVLPVVSMADILVSEKVEGTTLLKTASGEEGNALLAKESPADAQGLTEASNTQETKETEEIPKILVDLVAPEVVAGAVDSDGQEDEREGVQTDRSSREKIPCSELGNDLGMCVRSLSDMNVTIRRLDTDTLLSDVVTNDPVVSEELARHLDIEYRHGHVSCWRDVADLLAIPPSLYEHCLMYSKSSPTEDLFAFLAAAKPDTTMHDIKDVLRTMERLDVVQTVDKYLARSDLKDDIVAGTLVEKDEEYILGRIALKLDKSQPQNWRALAAGLEIPRKVFRNFGSQHQHNSALLLLKYLPIFDPELSVAMLKDTLDEIDRSDVVQVLDAAGIPDNDQIKDILDDVELMDQVSDLLNEQGLVDGKTWRHLAKELGVPKEKRRIFEPADDRPSPTKLLLKSVESFDPDITVEELILALVAMKRYDVLEALKKYFESEDIHKILEENNLLPPADDSTCSRLDAEGDGEYTDSEQEGDDMEA